MNGSVTQLVPDFLIDDLSNSGLEPSDVRARIAGPNEKQATNTPVGVDAYVLPYFDMHEKPLPFYRAKLINSPDPKIKYKQVATSSNHVYFPKGLATLLRTAKYIIITEGEKKAAKAVKEGFPCVALGGVDSWKNRTVVLHKDAQIGTTKSGQVVAKLPAGAEVTEQVDTLANGMRELIDFVMKRGIPIIICFDSDLTVKEHVRFEVQRAAATLGYELRHRGIAFSHIKQLILSPEAADVGEKLGLDDFLVNEDLGADTLREQIADCLKARASFPRHPNPREFVNRKLQKSNIARSDMQALSTAIICDLDVKGLRMHCPDDDNMYYFDEASYKLMKVVFSPDMGFSKTPFGVKLYNDYGLTSADLRLITFLNAQFCGEQPVNPVKPERVMAIKGDALYYQISDGMMVKVDASGIMLLNNGEQGVLFEGDMVQPIDEKKLTAAVRVFKAKGTLECQWYPSLQEARVKESTNDYSRRLLALLYSISPWMYRWRATQLPLEQMLGEAGSGKSTLYSLRQQIISGVSSLRNAPRDLRDWTASIAATGALHVTDNVHMSNTGLKQQLSDELCRVITESNPHIESRKLYTDNDLIRVPVKTVFAVTAIKQPFTNTDIIQRSIITELDKGTDDVSYDADWEGTQLKRYGGRVYWVAHQLVFMQRLFQLIEKDWQENYKAKFRLINVEQLLILAAKVYGWEWQWIPSYLEHARDERTAKSDAVLEGLMIWADHIRNSIPAKRLAGTGFTTRDMVAYFEADEEWEDHPILTNGRKLGHWLDDKKNLAATIAGVVFANMKKGNYNAYRVEKLDGQA
jgi:hypothetical protein